MRWIIIIGMILTPSCSYLHNAAVQNEYRRIQETDPSMLNLKHMVEQDTFFVYGKVLDQKNTVDNNELAIVAYSDRYQQHEIVDVMHQLSPNTHYGLNLPPGQYDLVVFADLDQNDIYEDTEKVGGIRLELVQDDTSPMVISDIDISLGAAQSLEWPAEVPVKKVAKLKQSLFFPAGTLRQLDDPLFDTDMSTLGMYHPAAFLERASTMFYALEENIDYKVPVIFVHGIDGSAREFKHIVERLDRTYYKPWFFYYPSGGDLGQMAQFFHKLFLSGKVIPLDEKMPIVVVAHSMGGLVVREALNRLDHSKKMRINFISLASPFGGHPAAAAGEDKGLIAIASWRDLNPDNNFIKNLHRQSLPPTVTHQLMYAYANPKRIKLGQNSDGVVPLSSQLPDIAQSQATKQTGFNTSHIEILHAPGAIDHLIDTIEQTEITYPKENMRFLLEGGFAVELDNSYTKKQAHIIQTYGKYIRALVQRKIMPANEYQIKLISTITNKTKPKTDSEIAWQKFVLDYPNWATLR